jgi:hypothetical protein
MSASGICAFRLAGSLTMIQGRYEKIVTAIVEAVLTRHQVRYSPESLKRVVAFIIEQQQRMPDFLRAPLVTLTFILDVWPHFPVSISPFHRQPIASRIPLLGAWSNSRLAVRRDLVRFYESLAVFGWASGFEEGADG